MRERESKRVGKTPQCPRKMAEGTSQCPQKELTLKEEDFNLVITLSKHKNHAEVATFLDRLTSTFNAAVGPNTFRRHPKLQRPAPLVVAAQHGCSKVVEYFCERYGHAMDVNETATIISLTTKKKVHCATALWAASTGGHLEIVEYLISRGADVNKPTLTQSTPLRGASFHGHLKVMKYLLEKGADINTPNCIGQSPLCIAAMRGQLEAVQFLVSQGADIHQKTINGYSVIHLAATKGRLDIVKFLLSSGISPLFLEAQPMSDDYIPCPLFLAASTGQRRMVEELMEHPECPVSCKSDALLLLGATRCEISSRGLTMSSKEMWTKALQIREENNLEVTFLPANEHYGRRTEMRTLDDLHTLAKEPNFFRYEAYFQSLIIRERCMGYGDQGLIYFLIRRGLWCVNHNNYKEAELLWFRAMDMELRVCEIEISHARFGHSEGLQRDLEKDLSQYACGIWHMVHNDYHPQFSRFVEFGFKELEILQCLKERLETAPFIDMTAILGILIYIFASWVYYDNEVNQTERLEGVVCSPECTELGKKFVSKYLYMNDSSTLLHLALSNFPIFDEEERIYDKHPDLRALITALLQWGADEAVNALNSRGLRPIHLAIFRSNENKDNSVQELVSPLIMAGAHVDAINKQGLTAQFLCTNDLVRVVLFSTGPLPLYCQAAKRIVSENVPYSNIGLPTHIVGHISLHDQKAVNF